MRTSIKYLVCYIGSAGNPLTIYCEHSSREAALDELRKREAAIAEAAKSHASISPWDRPFYIFEVVKTESE